MSKSLLRDIFLLYRDPADIAAAEEAAIKSGGGSNVLEVKLIQTTQAMPPVLDYSNTGNVIYSGKYVCEVAVAHPNGAKIRLYLKILSLTSKLRLARCEYQKAVYTKDQRGNSKPLEKAEENLKKLQLRFDQRIAKYNNADSDATDSICEAAFVVFDHEESYIRCLQDYGRYYNWLKRTLFQPKFMCFHKDGKYYPLQVKRAPEPDDVTWENLEITLTSRNIRRAITAFLTLILILVSFALIVAAQVGIFLFLGHLLNTYYIFM